MFVYFYKVSEVHIFVLYEYVQQCRIDPMYLTTLRYLPYLHYLTCKEGYFIYSID